MICTLQGPSLSNTKDGVEAGKSTIEDEARKPDTDGQFGDKLQQGTFSCCVVINLMN